jgi:hypothetical protein
MHARAARPRGRVVLHARADAIGPAVRAWPVASSRSAFSGRMTNNELAAFYRRYNACCNEHRFEDLAEFVARSVAIDLLEQLR